MTSPGRAGIGVLAVLMCAAVRCGAEEGSVPQTAPHMTPPDVVLITLDTTRADRLGAYGHGAARTPVLDGLAQRGRRYQAAYSVTPLTIPAHASLFTGHYPPVHGVRDNGSGVLPQAATTLAEVLSDAGWRTGASVGAFVTTPVWGLGQGFDVVLTDGIDSAGSVWHAERSADVVVADALRWKSEQPDVDPLFLWVHLFDAHLPYAQRAGDDPNTPYDNELAAVDRAVGQLLEGFDLDDTVVVIVGDHGESLGEHGEGAHGLYVYNATQRVPYLMAGPGIDVAVVTEPTSLVDVMPTMLDALGLPVPDGLDGVVVPGTVRPLYMESWQLNERFGLSAHRAIVDGEWVLIDQPRPELYNVRADPGQMTNLAGDQPERVTQMQGVLAQMDWPDASGPRGPLDPTVAAQLAALGYTHAPARLSVSEAGDAKDHQELIRGMSELQVLMDRQRVGQALALTESLSERYPDVLDLALRRVRLLVQTRDFDAAEAMLIEVARRFPDSPAGRHAQASVWLAQERYAEAAAVYAALADELPYQGGLRARAVWAWMQSPDTIPVALERGRAWQAAHPSDTAVAGLMGLLLLNQGRPEEAVASLRSGCEATPPIERVCQHVGAYWAASGDTDRSTYAYQRELAFHPRNVEALYALQRVLNDQRDWPALDAMATHALLHDPGRDLWLHARAQARFNQNDLAGARTDVDALLAINGGWSKALLLDANLLMREGKTEQAERRAEEARAASASEQ